MGEVKISPYSSTTLSTFFCRAEKPCLEVVATVFFLPLGQIIWKKNFLVWEMSLPHFFVVTKEIVGGGGTSGILYNLFPKVTITAQGWDSYTSCHFHKYGWPNNASETSIGAMSHNTSSVKGLIL